MPKYLINPIHAYDQIKENYKLYLKTAFGTRYTKDVNGVQSFESERNQLLDTDKVLSREPWIEPLPAYKSGKHVSKLTQQDIPNMDNHSLELFKDFVTRGLINDKFPLYEHQQKMLELAMSGKNCIITSGTGSGKTESFLLPLFASLIKEAATWKAPSSPYTINNWWSNGTSDRNVLTFDAKGIGHLSDQAAQRTQDISISFDATDEHIPAIRAVILYPMNALVDDQMTRLREALDSDAVQDFMDDEKNGLKGNRFFFGRYNGETPGKGMLRKVYFNSAQISGHNDDCTCVECLKKKEEQSLEAKRKKMIEDLKEAMVKLEERTDEVIGLLDYANAIGNTQEEKDKDFTNNKKKYKIRRSINSMMKGKDGRVTSEMRSRLDMQQTPPDILITNFSMLAIMLMREVEDPMLKQTREWLDRDPDKMHPTRIFHLIIDELHLNRGTAGTEVAYLIRLFLKRIGLPPMIDNGEGKMIPNPQLRILSSSASLDVNGAEEEGSLNYLNDFFGCDFKKENIIEGVDKPIKETYTGKLPIDPFRIIKELFDKDNLCFEKYDVDTEVKIQVDSVCADVASTLTQTFAVRTARWQNEDGLIQLLGVLNSKELALSKRLLDAFTFDGKQRAIALSECNGDNNTLNKCFDSELFDGTGKDIRDAAEGLVIARGLFDVVADKKDENGEALYPTELPRFRFHFFFRNIPGLWATIDRCDWANNRPVGRLHPDAEEVDGTQRVAELLYCETCGSVYYGGKRLVHTVVNPYGVRERVIEMLPTNSATGSMPEQSSQLIIDKKKYSEFVVFYPIDTNGFDYNSMERTQLIERGILLKHRMMFKPQYGGQNTDTAYDADWQLATLDMYSGTIRPIQEASLPFIPNSQIPGYVYVVDHLDNNEDDAKMAPALPTHCPHCGQENIKSPYRPSSLRGFRTGFAKSTQLFAKELFYQLPTVNKSKLVSFSDSREDAAKVANDIEREQYRDVVREVLIDILENNKEKQISQLKKQEDILNQCYSLINSGNALPMVVQLKNECERNINDIKARLGYTQFYDLINDAHFLESELYQQISNLGINPAGLDWEAQKFQLNTNYPYKEWYKVNISASTERDALTKRNLKAVQEVLAGTVFGKLYFGLESAGVGYPTILPDKDFAQNCIVNHNITQVPVDSFLEIVTSCIRILGEKNNYDHNRYGVEPDAQMCYETLPTKHALRKYIRKCCDKYGIQRERDDRQGKNDLSRAVEEYMVHFGHQHLYLLTDKLYIKSFDKVGSAFVCPRCRRVHLHASGGICYGCGKELNPVTDTVPIADIRKNNYIMLNNTLNRKACKIHCEELTGQTDDQTTRQNEFRDIINIPADSINRELEEKVRSIDLLSVTTTLEVGVDIGPLQGVLLANMPPQRFNYQQRVGRGGRRGQAYSLVMTLCRGRNHDNYYYDNPQKITGDRPPVPFLSMRQIEIAQRLFAKELLHKVFKCYSGANNVFLEGNVHGEFGKKDEWTAKYKSYVKTWLEDTSHKAYIQELANTVSSLFSQQLVDYATKTTNPEGLFCKMVNALENADFIVQEHIAECLAEAGVLPMYGMPTRSRSLYSGFRTKNNEIISEISSTDRDLDMAITAYAPNCSITKDKRMVTAIGFTQPSLKTESRFVKKQKKRILGLHSESQSTPIFPLNMDMYKCSNIGCGKIEVVNHDPNNPPTRICSCHSLMEKSNLRTPSAFITDMTPGENNRDGVGVVISRNAVTVEATNHGMLPDRIDANYKVSLAKQDYTWRINGNEIEGCDAHVRYRNPSNTSDIYSSASQWVANGIIQGGEPLNFPVNQQGVPTGRIVISRDEGKFETTIRPAQGALLEKIKLASRKVTNVIRLTFDNPGGLPFAKLNPFEVDQNSLLLFNTQGVRAAYYSLAFILQRAIASNLDVDPEEIDVAEVIPNGICAQIALADELVNGSGFVNDLYEKFPDYCDKILNSSDPYFRQMLSDEHRAHCDSSCYKCLQMYRNMPYHGLLDWRLGIALFRLMTDVNYMMGTDGNFNYPELRDWKSMAYNLLIQLKNSYLTPAYQVIDDTVPYIITPNGRYIFAVHPLWSVDPQYNFVLASAIVDLGINSNDIITIDTFNMLRRLGMCYEEISEQL